ncbi:invasion associated locus B family protein [Rhizobium sp. L51/94]|uniref:invasion associated locus B family protein n=1 Tax=Rhizobium sp. L51/94 TaxID=2819999 RepID=UPI001C5AF4AA|nr:invasion associated locus B family protein [Rhizobium sp. L51/94]QXZ80939.1 invasion associated locus B family protein [Rhizobium sp. L51/94]
MNDKARSKELKIMRSNIHRIPIILAIASFLGLGIAGAQAQQGTGPLFSTPAQRSTTGAPILNGSASDQGGEILNKGISRRPMAPNRDKPSPSTDPNVVSSRSTTASPDKPTWVQQCASIEKEGKICQASGSVRSPDGKQVVLVMSLAPTPDGKVTAMQMAVPLGISLKAGIKIDIEGGYTTTMPVSRCTPQGCIVEGNVDAAMIEDMKVKSVATITVSTVEGKTIAIKLPLAGFADVARWKPAAGK